MSRKHKYQQARVIRRWWNKRRDELRNMLLLTSTLSDGDWNTMQAARQEIITRYNALLSPAQHNLRRKMICSNALPAGADYPLGERSMKPQVVNVVWDEASKFDWSGNPDNGYARTKAMVDYAKQHHLKPAWKKPRGRW